MSAAGVNTLVQQFTLRHMAKLAHDFAFPTAAVMVATWGYKRTYHMASSMVNMGWGWATSRPGVR